MKATQILMVTLWSVSAALASPEIYVRTLANAEATLDNGIPFMMEKDDNYPFVTYDPSQTLVQLRLGPFTFWARKSNVAFVSETEVPAAAQKYAADATRFLEALKASLAQQAPTQQQSDQESIQQMQQLVDLMKSMQDLQSGQQRQSDDQLQQLMNMHGRGGGLSKNDRIRMLYLLRDQGVISSIRRGESMSDQEIMRLYQNALQEQRLRDIERAVRQR